MFVGIFPDLLPGSSVLECRRALLSLMSTISPPRHAEWFDYKLNRERIRLGARTRTREHEKCFILVVIGGMAKVLVEDDERKAGAECWRQLMKLQNSPVSSEEDNEMDGDEDLDASADQGFRGISSFRSVRFSDIISTASDSEPVYEDKFSSSFLPDDAGFVEFTLEDGCVIKGSFLYHKEVKTWEGKMERDVEKRKERMKRRVRVVKMQRAKEEKREKEDGKKVYRTDRKSVV